MGLKDAILRKIDDEEQRHDKRLELLHRQIDLAEMLPTPVDERFEPDVDTDIYRQLGFYGALEFGIYDPIKDTEVSILMCQYPPEPMYMVEGTREFKHTTQEHWDDIWFANDIDLPNGSIEYHIPISPFVVHASYIGQSLRVIWHTKVGDVILRCIARLDQDEDASYWEDRRPKARKYHQYVFHHQFAGPIHTIQWWTENRTGGNVTVYWEWPDTEEYRKWGDVIDFMPRNEARE